jgi:membrane-associated phospholipid phosphatase
VSIRVLTGRSASNAPSTHRRLDRTAVALATVVIAAAALFVVLAVQVASHRGLARSDPRLLADIIGLRSSVLTSFAKVITDLGTAFAYLLLAGAGYWYWHKKRSVALPIAALSWMVVGLFLRFEISRLVARPRPAPVLRLVSAHGFAFPSGHTATATIGCGFMAALLWQVVARRWRVPLVTVSVVAAAAVGLSRSYLGVHWPTDVLGGWAYGIAWGSLGGLILCIGSRRRLLGSEVSSRSRGHLKGGQA